LEFSLSSVLEFTDSEVTMTITAPPIAETRWFTDTRMRILVADDRCSVVEAVARHGNMPPLHVHLDEDETFYVLEGRLTLLLPGSAIEADAGRAAFAPRGIPHAYRVESETARWVVVTTTGGFASFVEETSVPASDDGYAPLELMATPDVLAAAAAARGIELLGPPGATP
jgi:quercetin dioxygenase-like cupin family protein